MSLRVTRLRRRWWIVVASLLGLMVGSGSINSFGVGVFMKPVSEDLGLGRAEFSTGVLLANALNGLLAPLIGYLVDRWGSRSVLLPGSVMFALAIASMSMLQSSAMFLFFAAFVFAGICGAMQSNVPYSHLVCQWFDRDRGVALGIAMSGVGLGVAVVPAFTAWLIDGFGWRIAYWGLGAAIFTLGFLPALLFVHAPAAVGRSSGGSLSAPGLTLRQAIGRWQFWALAPSFFVSGAAVNGMLAHVVSLLADRGLPIGSASSGLSGAGAAMIVGRFVCGYALDRFHGPYVAVVFFTIAIVGIALLAPDVPIWGVVLGIALCGLFTGGNVGLQIYLVSRYFGMRSYGQIYGIMFGLFLVGNGFGALAAGYAFDLLGSYDAIRMVFEALLLTSVALIAPLGAYAYPAIAVIAPPAAAGPHRGLG
jgi:MFS family permease